MRVVHIDVYGCNPALLTCVVLEMSNPSVTFPFDPVHSTISSTPSQMSYFALPCPNEQCAFFHFTRTYFVAAPLPTDAEQHRGRAQLDHHLPHAHQPGDSALWQVVRVGGRRGSK